MLGKRVPECCSGLCPEKELPERHSTTKMPLPVTTFDTNVTNLT
jgi:hypothetical protein